MMKKNLCAIILTGIMAVFSASAVMAAGTDTSTTSKSQAGQAQIEEKTGEKEKKKSESSTEKEEYPSFEADLIDDMEIVTPYYTFTTPVRWMGAYTIETLSNQTGMWLEIRYKDNSKEPYNGHLFSVLLTDKEDYTIIADHDLLGELLDKEGHAYHVVAVYPTDVQYSLENKDNYMAMSKEAEAVLDTLKAADGCSYTKVEKDTGEAAE